MTHDEAVAYARAAGWRPDDRRRWYHRGRVIATVAPQGPEDLPPSLFDLLPDYCGSYPPGDPICRHYASRAAAYDALYKAMADWDPVLSALAGERQ